MIGFDDRTGAVRAARARKTSRVYNVDVSSGAAAPSGEWAKRDATFILRFL